MNAPMARYFSSHTTTSTKPTRIATMALPSLIRSVLSSRKRKPSGSNAVDSSTDPPSSAAKRARNQTVETATQTTQSPSDTTAVANPSSSLPSLELSNTFESTTSSSTSPTSHSSEYYTAVTAAKARLQTAQLIATQSQQNLSRAQIEFNRSSLELQHAIDLYGVEKRWGVIDVDSEVSSSASSDNDDADSSPPPQSDDGRVVVAASNGNENTANDDTTIISGGDQGNGYENSIQQIQVNQAGESIVNGTYNLLVNSTTLINHYYHTMPKGPIYIHTEGPFSIQNEDFDVCIFQKRGYGDKIRWCIALVPASLNDEVTCIGLSNDDNDTNDEEEKSRSRNFALAYIYYWMEVDANEAMNDASSLLLNGTNDEGPSSLWGVCHGTRPLPMLKNVSNNGKKWWQIWK